MGEDRQNITVELNSKFAEMILKRRMTQDEFNTLMVNIERMVMSTGTEPL